MAQFTKKAIAASFLRLAASMPFDKITVRDIVEDCGVNRNTFYYYYRDIYDLARDVLASSSGIADSASGLSPKERLMKFVCYTRENPRTIKNMYHSVGREQAEIYLSGFLGDMPQELVEQAAKCVPDEAVLQLTSKFVLHTVAGLLFDWIEDGMQMEPAELVQTCMQLVNGGLAAYFDCRH